MASRLEARAANRERDIAAREAERAARREAEMAAAAKDPHAAAAKRHRTSGRKDVVREQRDTRGYATLVDEGRIRELAKRGASLGGLAAAFGISEDEIQGILARSSFSSPARGGGRAPALTEGCPAYRPGPTPSTTASRRSPSPYREDWLSPNALLTEIG